MEPKNSIMKFALPIDSMDFNGDYVLAGMSQLDGNIWGGQIELRSASSNSPTVSSSSDTGITCVKFCGHSSIIATGDDGLLKLFNYDLNCVATCDAHDDVISKVISSTSGNIVISTGWDGTVNVWQHSDAGIQLNNSLYDCHYGRINDVCFTNAGSDVISTVGHDGLLRLWDLRQNSSGDSNCVSLINLHQIGTCVERMNELSTVAVGLEDGRINTYDLRMSGDKNSSTVVEFLDTYNNNSSRIRCLSRVSNNGLAVGSDDGLVSLVCMQTNSRNDRLDSCRILHRHRKAVTAVRALPDANICDDVGNPNLVLASSSHDHTLVYSSLST